jgi:hypothetical protein
MTFEDVLKRHVSKMGETWGNATETIAEMLDRVTEAYWRICKETGCTWREPVVATLAAVTATTNQHDIVTMLSLSNEVFSVHKVYWDGKPLNRWNKDRIDQMNLYDNQTLGGDPRAYAFWEEYATDTTTAKTTYMAFWPFISSADTTNCYVSYFELPDKPTSSNYATKYPVFGEEYHHLIAELSALEHLRDLGDSRYTPMRWKDCWTQIAKMRDKYVTIISSGERAASPASATAGGSKYHFYGE